MKQLKIFFIIISVLVGVIVIDTLLAIVFEINPLISFEERFESGSRVAKGILVDTYYCVDDKEKTNVSWHFKTSKFTCPIYEKEKVFFMEDIEEDFMVDTIKMKVNEEVLNVKLEKNTAASVLVQILKNRDITIEVNDYGGFEKVGNLDFSLPMSDSQITTSSGDIMLYQGNKITIFYESNTWSYTRLGKIVGKTSEELKSIFGYRRTTIVFSLS